MATFNSKIKILTERIDRLPEHKKALAEALLDKVKFMETELKKLQKTIKAKGWTEEYKNGENQKGIKKCSEGEAYNTLIKNYNSTMKMLLDVLDSEEDEQRDIKTIMDVLSDD